MLIKKIFWIPLFFVSFIVQVTSSNAESITLNGELSQGGFITGKVAPGVQVFLNEKEIQVTPKGAFVFGFGRDAEPESVVAWGYSGEALTQKTLAISQRSYPTQYVEGVPQKTVTPPPEKLVRIKKETALVKEARKTNSKLEYFLDDFKAPMKGPITGVYGSQRVYNGTPKRPHFGLDYAGPVGAPVYAPASGTVTLIHNDMYYSGGTLIVDHGYGVSSTFIHLSEILVKEGDEVKQGDPIAKVGKGGRSTGPHLDWRVNWFDVRIDPQLVLDKAAKGR